MPGPSSVNPLSSRYPGQVLRLRIAWSHAHEPCRNICDAFRSMPSPI